MIFKASAGSNRLLGIGCVSCRRQPYSPKNFVAAIFVRSFLQWHSDLISSQWQYKDVFSSPSFQLIWLLVNRTQTLEKLGRNVYGTLHRDLYLVSKGLRTLALQPSWSLGNFTSPTASFDLLRSIERFNVALNPNYHKHFRASHGTACRNALSRVAVARSCWHRWLLPLSPRETLCLPLHPLGYFISNQFPSMLHNLYYFATM